jgi:hypothetical protein
MPDWGPGFKPGTDRPSCIHHGEEFLSGGVDEHDVGYTVCLACAEADGRLTAKGARTLEDLRVKAPMPALTLMQPWATLIALGRKKIETRGWHPRENPGVLAIASSKKMMSRAHRRMASEQEPFRSALGDAELPSGVIVAVAVVTGFERTEQIKVSGAEALFGDFSLGRWAWHLGEVVALDRPIHVSGARGVWKVPRYFMDNDGRPGPLVRAIGGRNEYRRLLRSVPGR